MSVLMRSVSGIRGIVGAAFHPSLIAEYVNAFIQVTGAKKVVIGRDTRPTGDMVETAVAAACRASGADVVLLGIATTPTVEMAVLDAGAGGGIIITASHNPVEWNALKFLTHEGIFLDEAQVKRLFEIVDQKQFAWKPWNGLGQSSRVAGAISSEMVTQGGEIPVTAADIAHVDAVLGLPFIEPERIKMRRFKVAYDGVNGAGSLIVPYLLKRLGCEVHAIYVTPNGIFPHDPEPTPTHLAELSEVVRQRGCDIGFATDPDADRCAFVDEKGQCIGEEYTLAFAVDLVLSQRRGPVTLNLSTSRMSEDIAARYDVPVIRAKVGEINVTVEMKKNGSVIGGEGNGGVILPDLHYGRDGILAVAMVLQWMAVKNASVSEIAATIPAYTIDKRKFSATASQVIAATEALKKRFPDAALDDRDGLRLAWSKSWVHVRPSNTEPVVRVIAEAPSATEAANLCEVVGSIVKESR